jgi:hypothetical protein
MAKKGKDGPPPEVQLEMLRIKGKIQEKQLELASAEKKHAADIQMEIKQLKYKYDELRLKAIETRHKFDVEDDRLAADNEQKNHERSLSLRERDLFENEETGEIENTADVRHGEVQNAIAQIQQRSDNQARAFAEFMAGLQRTQVAIIQRLDEMEQRESAPKQIEIERDANNRIVGAIEHGPNPRRIEMRRDANNRLQGATASQVTE